MSRLDIETRREQLTEAAVRIALTDGLDNTTVRRVAAQAGVSLGTVHYCFEGKAELLEAVVEYLLAREVDTDALVFDPHKPPLEGLRAGFAGYWEASGADREYQRLVYELVTYLIRQEDPGPALARRIFASNYALIDGLFDRFAQTYQLRFTVERKTLIRTIVAMTDGVAIAWLADSDAEAAQAVLDACARMIAAMTEPM